TASEGGSGGVFRRRRLTLKGLATGGCALALPAGSRTAFGAESADVVIRLVAAPDRASIRPGAGTQVLRFRAEVLRGRRDAVHPSTSYLGPTLELRRGERVRIEFVNRTSEPSIVHWHGMIVPDRADGHPRFAVAPGRRYVYEFTVRNPAGTYLYHPHPHGSTGRQVYFGLAGMLIVRDDDERFVGLPSGEHELALVIQDRRIGDDNALVFKRMMMDTMTGVLGDTVLVNGVADARFAVAPRSYRLRVANASNARIYKLAWSDGRPMHAVAADNGLFDRREGVQTRPYVVLAPFQRVELLEDFGARQGNAEVALVSRPFEASGMMEGMMGGGMMGGGMMGGGMKGGGMMGGGMMGSTQGSELSVARFAVASGTRAISDPPRLPDPPAPLRVGNVELHTRIAFNMMQGSLNGRAFQMSAVASDERLPLGVETVWTFANDSGPMAMPHPMHIHGVRFRIIERGAGAPPDLRDGLIDSGYHDTVLVFPGERVRLAVAPTQPGMFMYHCHNLEHEDGGMMRNCWFGPGSVEAA
ncbi:MAG: multicopper oxidase domain-containing protein, partial [Casimicrobiaceae bacterium]